MAGDIRISANFKILLGLVCEKSSHSLIEGKKYKNEGEFADANGLHRQNIKKYKTGELSLTVSQLKRICMNECISMNWLTMSLGPMNLHEALGIVPKTSPKSRKLLNVR